LGNLEGRDYSESLTVDGQTIRTDLMEAVEGVDWCGSGQEALAGPCEHDGEPSGSTKGGEFLD